MSQQAACPVSSLVFPPGMELASCVCLARLFSNESVECRADYLQKLSKRVPDTSLLVTFMNQFYFRSPLKGVQGLKLESAIDASDFFLVPGEQKLKDLIRDVSCMPPIFGETKSSNTLIGRLEAYCKMEEPCADLCILYKEFESCQTTFGTLSRYLQNDGGDETPPLLRIYAMIVAKRNKYGLIFVGDTRFYFLKNKWIGSSDDLNEFFGNEGDDEWRTIACFFLGPKGSYGSDVDTVINRMPLGKARLGQLFVDVKERVSSINDHFRSLEQANRVTMKDVIDTYLPGLFCHPILLDCRINQMSQSTNTEVSDHFLAYELLGGDDLVADEFKQCTAVAWGKEIKETMRSLMGDAGKFAFYFSCIINIVIGLESPPSGELDKMSMLCLAVGSIPTTTHKGVIDCCAEFAVYLMKKISANIPVDDFARYMCLTFGLDAAKHAVKSRESDNELDDSMETSIANAVWSHHIQSDCDATVTRAKINRFHKMVETLKLFEDFERTSRGAGLTISHDALSVGDCQDRRSFLL